jgi:hypothetical protein
MGAGLMEEPVIDESFVKEVGEMLMQIHELLKLGLVPLEERVDYTIKHRITDERWLDKLLSDLLDYTQIDEGLVVFKRLCRYSFYIYPQLTADYIYIYRDLFDPEYNNDEKECTYD